MIPFNKPPLIGTEEKYILEAMKQSKISGDGNFSKKCQKWFEEKTKAKVALLTTSCTHALEMSALLIGLKEGDEVIMPSYTFVSTANAFALRGAKIVFVDIRPDTMNIDETKIENAINENRKGTIMCDTMHISSIKEFPHIEIQFFNSALIPSLDSQHEKITIFLQEVSAVISIFYMLSNEIKIKSINDKFFVTKMINGKVIR